MVFTGRIPANLIKTETSKVKFSGQRVSHMTKVEKGVPLVMTYHPLLKSTGKIIYNLYLLNLNEELKHLFTPGPMVSFRSSRKIGSSLVRAKLYPFEKSAGSFNCKRSRCQICAYANETDSFNSMVTGETYIIKHRFDCMLEMLDLSSYLYQM